jgi:aminoglycoside phosphotransferase (APT) family kinase protein
MAGSELPLVARHNDLTMWNVLAEERGAIGVIDWAEAEPAGLPLTDFFYAVADAAYAADGSRSRLGAVRACFSPDGARAAAVAPLRERLRATLELSPDAAELCFHACWLRHALNERRSPAASNGEFLEVVRWLAHRALEAG